MTNWIQTDARNEGKEDTRGEHERDRDLPSTGVPLDAVTLNVVKDVTNVCASPDDYSFLLLAKMGSKPFTVSNVKDVTDFVVVFEKSLF
jgi:hypothetical protein